MEAAQNPAAQAQAQAPQPQQPPKTQSQPSQPQQSSKSYHHKDRDRAASRATSAASGADSGFLDYGPGPSDYDYSDSRGGDKGSASRGGRKDKDNFRGGGAAGTKDHKGINRALIGTKPCSFWAQGKCAKGDQCTFRHDPNDLK
ncbi:C-x8-C-x5-C-x3-H type zinc finger protein [Apiospora rasikravindrae]|uniref:C-x8-C-x5-C-x3-H type zinc finger protein n=1 Tax=Apiospora rasikravindrae TaxID=990691 RepID=A0ABR1S3L7_9PEZI